VPYSTCVRSNPRSDRLAAESVAGAGFETFVPRTRIRAGPKWRTVSLFPLYFFARIESQWKAIERAQGVHAVIRFGERPARVPDAEIAWLMSRSDPDGLIRLTSPRRRSGNRAANGNGARFASDVPVTVMDGPFHGFHGLTVDMSGEERVVILLELLGRQVPVQVDASLIIARP
jgi:transcriptional antiterminator RfaH